MLDFSTRIVRNIMNSFFARAGQALTAFILAFGFMFGVPSSAQAQVGPAEFLAIAAESISEIRVEGSQRIEKATIESYLLVSPGDAFDADKIDKSLKTLFATGLFADVTIRREQQILFISVIENPIINRIDFEGNLAQEDADLTKELQLRPREVFTRARVQADVQRLLEIYRRSGKFAAVIEPKVIQLPQNRVDLIFEINEGDETGIRKIIFIGNDNFSDKKLKNTLVTTESRWYNFLAGEDNYDPDRLAFDREQLRKYYLARGYADFRIISAVAELTPDRKDFFITFTLEEGPVYRFGDIDVDVTVKDLEPERMRELTVSRADSVYNAEYIDQSIENMTFAAGQRGYAFIDIRPRITRDRERKTIDILYNVEEGPRVYVERIDIVGNVRTLDKVIRREFRFAEGDAFNTSNLRRSRQRIRGLGFFENVEIEEYAGTTPDSTVIKVEVEEKSTGELSLGAGFSSADAFVFDISVRERNLLGRGQRLALRLGIGSETQQIDASFTEPRFLDRRISAGVDLFNIVRDLQDESSFDRESLGMSLRAGTAVTEFLTTVLTYTIRVDKITDVSFNASPLVRELEGDELASSIGYRLTYDQRDDPLLPTSGYRLSGGQTFAGLGGDVRYIRTTFNADYFYLVTNNVVSVFGLSTGFIEGLGRDISITDRFFIGGDDFRGFDQSGIGPRDVQFGDALGANLFYVGSLDVTFPLGLPEELGVSGGLFTDVGSASGIDQESVLIVDSSALRASFGAQISWDSPFGPVKLIFANAFLKEDFDNTESFRFSFGTRF